MSRSPNDSICRTWRERCRRIFHWGPIMALSVIFFITCVSYHSCLWMFPPSHSFSGALQLCFLSLFLYLILNSYFSALFVGPGFVPLGWKPSISDAQSKLQFCHFCNGYKPPRAHHCRSCQRCVMKMDHHCPWINTCCGHLNHGYFLHFVLSVPVGCSGCIILLCYAVYHDWIMLPYAFIHQRFSTFTDLVFDVMLVVFALGLAIGVTLSVGTLACYHLLAVCRNQTGIESWIVTKAMHWRSDSNSNHFRYPYDLGKWKNISQVLSWSGRAMGDGIHWPLAEGCGEYDLTIEQLRQKQFKSVAGRDYIVHHAYNGQYCPCCCWGCRTALDSPYPDETRLRVKEGDIIFVTRCSKHWMYGQLRADSHTTQSGTRSATVANPRGWIPRACAVEMAKNLQYTLNRTINTSRLKRE